MMPAVADGTIGERIRRLRMERGMTLASVVGGDFSRAFLNQVELGRSQPSTRVLRVIASRLGTQVEYLLDGSTPSLDRQVALERARISLSRGHLRRSLAELEPALESEDWPLGTDARLTAAQALIGLGRDVEADELLAAEEPVVSRHGDRYRLRRLRALRGRRPLQLSPDRDTRALGEAHAGLGDQLLRKGRSSAALEHYQSARVLLEAADALALRSPGGTGSSVEKPAGA